MKIPRPSRSFIILCFGFFVVTVIWVYYGKHRLQPDLPSEGQYGDKFGALNTLFTGLALVGLLATIIMQHDERVAGESDHRELVEAQNANTRALNNQLAAHQRSNYLNALVASIEGYSHQQHRYTSKGSIAPGNLIIEQDTLYWELVEALEQARVSAGAQSNINAKIRRSNRAT